MKNSGNLSILCADLTGAEHLQRRLAASEIEHAIGRCEKRISQTVESYGGRLAKTSGSRVIAYFEEPDNALHSAVEMQRRIASLPPLSGVVLGVRVGVCIGHAANELRFFEGDAGNAASNLSGMAEPGQVLMSVPKRASGLHWDALVARSRPDVSLSCGKRQLGVFEIDWRNSGSARLKAAGGLEAEAPPLFLHAHGSLIELNAERPLLSVGRLNTCGLRLASPLCSRVHARIERRGDAFFLIDDSTNGSYVLPAGGSVHAVRRSELAISGSGVISFGAAPGSDGAEEFDYRLGEPA